MVFSPAESSRYARHLVLKGMGGQGQQALKAARVLVVGAGGLGSPVIAYLAAAGIGTLGIVDNDIVSVSNLQRQILHTVAAIGSGKAKSAAAFSAALNPHVTAVSHPVRFDLTNGADLVANYDLIVDGTDNFATRLIVADAAESAKKPLISGAVSMYDGQVTVLAPHLFRPDGTANPRFTTLYPEPIDSADLPSCEATGVLGPLTGVIGTLMAMEAIKLITGIGTPLIGRLLIYDGRDARFTELSY